MPNHRGTYAGKVSSLILSCWPFAYRAKPTPDCSFAQTSGSVHLRLILFDPNDMDTWLLL